MKTTFTSGNYNATAHTPGPWVADRYDVRQSRGRMVAYTGPHHTPASEYPASCRREDEANARLIAAAPDLLRALKHLADAPACPIARGLALDTIAKAEGRA